jgi:hypothetical protein
MQPTLNGARHTSAQSMQPSTMLGACVGCLGDRKVAEMQLLSQLAAGTAPTEEQAAALPPVAPALCLIGGTGSCYGHLQVQSQSPLIVPGLAR